MNEFSAQGGRKVRDPRRSTVTDMSYTDATFVTVLHVPASFPFIYLFILFFLLLYTSFFLFSSGRWQAAHDADI